MERECDLRKRDFDPWRLCDPWDDPERDRDFDAERDRDFNPWRERDLNFDTWRLLDPRRGTNPLELDRDRDRDLEACRLSRDFFTVERE